MALTRAQLLKQKKSTFRDPKEDPKNEQEEKPKPISLPKIPAGNFRSPTYLFAQQATQQKLYYEQQEEASDELIGYLQSPLKNNTPTLDSEEYPKIQLQEIQTYKGDLTPILIIKNQIELEQLILMVKLERSAVFAAGSAAFEKGFHLWYLPNGQFVAATKKQKSLKEMKQKQQPEKVEEVKKTLPKVPTKYIVILVILSIAVFVFAFKSSSDHVYSSENKVINRQKLLDQLELTAKATNQEIKNKYKKLAQQFHPDRNKDCGDCAEKFDQITAAYKKLLPGDFDIPTGFSEQVNQTVRRK